MDSECKIHDIAYRDHKDLDSRHKADKILEKAAFDRVLSKDSKFSERLNGLLVGTAMKVKTKLGMGMRRKKRGGKKKKRTSKSTIAFGTALRIIRNKKKYKKKKITENSPDFERTISSMIADSKRIFKNKKLKNSSVPRVIPIAKRGGVLPLLAVFAGLSALGSLMGGAAHVAKAVIDTKNAKKNIGKSDSETAIGNGMYLKPYKSGLGLYLRPFNSKN